MPSASAPHAGRCRSHTGTDRYYRRSHAGRRCGGDRSCFIASPPRPTRPPRKKGAR